MRGAWLKVSNPEEGLLYDMGARMQVAQPQPVDSPLPLPTSDLPAHGSVLGTGRARSNQATTLGSVQGRGPLICRITSLEELQTARVDLRAGDFPLSYVVFAFAPHRR